MPSKDPVTVSFKGPMTIQAVAATRMRMIDAMVESDSVVVDCSEVNDADFSFIQMLLAARLGAEQLGKTVRLNAPAAGAVRAALERAGFIDPKTPILNPLWVGK